jgi:putative DNA primase/helicase
VSPDERRQLWQSIPEEMQQLPQWCVCGPEYDADSSKRPFNPLTRRPASVTDPDCWATFEQAVQSGATNIGFVLSEDDPFFVVDLDTYKSQMPENHELILGAVETYAERSQSGEGFHVIGKGSVGRGRNSRFHGIEIYDRDRFIIMTGNRINVCIVAPDQPFADYMLKLLGPNADAEAQCYPASQPSDEKDEDVIARIASAQNGLKFSALFGGNVQLENGKDGDGHLCPREDALCYESQSEADLALIEMLCFSTLDDEQVTRIFLGSALGQRDKARRRDYVPRSIRSARAMIASNSLPLLDTRALMVKAGLTKALANTSSIPQLSGAILTRVSDVLSREVSWLWPNRIALGKVTVLAGPPGLGKSQFSIDAAARVTTGRGWPNGEGTAPAGTVIMLSCEDDIADTIRPRLEAAGADVDKVHVLEGIRLPKGGQRVFNLKGDIQQLEDALDLISDVKMVVIDPITAYMDGADTHNTGDVRATLAPLQELAMRRNVAVLAVSHLNKGGGNGASVNAVTGSIAFVAAARAAFLIAKDREEPERRLFLEIKNNISHARGLAFYVRERVLPNGIRAPYLEFQPGTIDVTADEALSQSSAANRGGSALNDAKDFILEQLRDGPVPATEVKERAEEEGIASKTLRKAREELCVIHRKETGQNGRWVWSLPLRGTDANVP